MKRFQTILMFVGALGMMAGVHSQVVREDVEGIVRFAKIESTVACAGAITPGAVTTIRDMGYQSIINLRRPTEEGANLEAEAAAAEAAGIKYVNLPFGGEFLDPAVADRFLETITEPDTAPAFIHCAGGGRAASMWFIKRVIVDAWDVDAAMQEATELGLSETSRNRQFALDYVASHAR